MIEKICDMCGEKEKYSGDYYELTAERAPDWEVWHLCEEHRGQLKRYIRCYKPVKNYSKKETKVKKKTKVEKQLNGMGVRYGGRDE